jgi:hypothetical protein
VEKAMGKAVVGRDAEDVMEAFGGALTVNKATAETAG